jgi:type II secretory pathway component PulL
MKLHAPIIFVSDDVWRIGVSGDQPAAFLETPRPEGTPVTEQVQALRQQLAGAGLVPGEVVLAIPSAWCLNAMVDCDGDARGDSKALLFALEEQLPIAAEDVVADFICHEGKAFGVCASRLKLAPLVEALESQGWSVAAICPAPLLAMPQWFTSSSQLTDIDAVLAREGEGWVVLRLVEGHLRSWHLLPAEDLQVLLRMLVLQTPHPPLRLLIGALPPGVEDALKNVADVTLVPGIELDLETAAVHAAEAVLAGRRRVSVDLSLSGRGRSLNHRLHRRIALAASSFAVFLLALIIAMLVLSDRMDHQTIVLQQEQARLFHQVAPASRRRMPVARYLASEQQRLSSGDGASTRSSTQALRMLLDLFARLPAQEPMQFSRLHIEPDQAELAGRVLSHEDAGRLATALGADGSLVVQPPQTTSDREAGVAFTIQVQRRNAVAVKEEP